MFYRSGWLRCDVFKCIGSVSCWWRLIGVLSWCDVFDVRCILYTIIIYYTLLWSISFYLLFFPSSPLPPNPSLLIFSSFPFSSSSSSFYSVLPIFLFSLSLLILPNIPLFLSSSSLLTLLFYSFPTLLLFLLSPIISSPLLLFSSSLLPLQSSHSKYTCRS